MIENNENIARIRKDRTFGACNGGWAYDAYPELETLDAGRSITIAEIKGPAVITNIHSTQHFIRDENLYDEDRKAMVTRGVILEIYYNDMETPSVRVPIGDFFGDGCCGKAQHFTTPFVEKAPESYNCFIPMPFETSAKVVIKNDTEYNMSNYSFVEFEKLPEWNDELGYFHAAWKRFDFQLDGKTDQHFFHVDGCGHLLGRAWSVCTDEPFFRGFHFVMEGNNEVRIDGDEEPRADYLGTEDSFGFSWGFQKTFMGLHNGMNFVHPENPSMLSIYRFRSQNPIRFTKSLDWRIDWSNEWVNNENFQNRITQLKSENRLWVDYATTFYWYQETPGYDHGEMMLLDDRVKKILHPNVVK
ncbi:DUF2961 domain-containing protein [Candidatus Poribacteria bacterium]|nr:DUF2961 domain-containing protein [Candidatus Poribacteria bacterium]